MVRVPSALPRVLIDHEEPLLAMGLRAALQRAPHLQIVGNDEAHFGVPLQVQVLVTDWSQGMRWLSADRADPSRAASVLVVSSQAREQPMLSALRRGLGGVLLASCTASELLIAVDALAAGRSYVCAEVAQRVAANFSREPLTTREETVLQLLARGQCNKSIATNLGIAPGTVKSHVKAILGKLAASTRTEAASIAAELGIVEFTRSPRFELASLN
ncbi:response regulator transcription factor [Mitsuaria sp. CC2]|uniref:LuxR C-terminal-related transcriptional regulator n=1 Tax=Mitsuaria sp. CC2 TaxID=3029186 RepID=UPI003B8ACD41